LRIYSFQKMSHICSSDLALFPEDEQTRRLFLELPIDAVQTYSPRPGATSFPQFRNLPTELRRKIWAATAPTPRIFCSFMDNVSLHTIATIRITGLDGNIRPAAMSVNRESRDEMMLRCAEYFNNTWSHKLVLVASYTRLYVAMHFSPLHDILFIPHQYQIARYSTKFTNIGKLQQLAIRLAFFQSGSEWVCGMIASIYPNLKELIIAIESPNIIYDPKVASPHQFVDLPDNESVSILSPIVKASSTVSQWRAVIQKKFDNLRGICCVELENYRLEAHKSVSPLTVHNIIQCNYPKLAEAVHPNATCRTGWQPPRIRIVQFKKKPALADRA
jgi:hypothetical protein